jgi:hypothetical protein
VRSEGIEKHDFGFIKNLSLGGAVLDPATAELLEKVFSSALLNQVSIPTIALLSHKISFCGNLGLCVNGNLRKFNVTEWQSQSTALQYLS